MSVTTTPPTGTALWRDGDPPGDRIFQAIGDLTLESGDHLPDVVLAYETWGALNPARDNAVLVEHALTGDSHVVGPSGPGHPTVGWWPDLVGPGALLDTDEYFVVAVNVLGGCQGSTGPGTSAADGRPWGSRFPRVTIRDQVAAEARLADALGIAQWHTVVGGSMGGMRTLEWVASFPDRVRTAVALASSGYATAEQIAWSQTQILAIRNDPWFAGGDYYDNPHGPEVGLGIARRIAHVTYRSELELHERFGRDEQDEVPGEDGRPRYAIESYLDHHGGKLAGRFDANSYIVLSEAMNSHDIGRGRGGLTAALAPFAGRLVLVPVDSDRLYPPRLSHEVAQAHLGAELATISSRVGHDGFLTEVDQVAMLLREAVSGVGPPDTVEAE
ncbi:homoserine O-acetyltransferase [Janibacter sp. Soil728]|uniref:homoserine O-acetyltransferase MetX n=1 Tax=Janibacter sp. Soil728 TaxID=1736393 RepID=UPI0006FBF9EB|nr:homoserine O-acetyltransferase [Janibacter sp. Soil728]KRE38622.1 homoserine O-acetyltransferase [Janibacter sp. Soil728]